MDGQELVCQALAKLEDRKRCAEAKRNKLDAFLDREDLKKRSEERKDLKRELIRWTNLMAKVRKAKEDPENGKDPIAQAFIKVKEIIDMFRDLGQLEKLDEYLLLLNNLEVSVRDKDWKKVKKPEEVEKLLENVSANDREKDGIDEEIKTLAAKAEEENLCLGSRFSKLVRAVKAKGKKSDEDLEDFVKKEQLEAELVSAGAELVEIMLKGS